MARSEITIQIKVQDLKAFRIAYDALTSIAEAEPDTDDPDTRDRAYGTSREIAEDALAAIDSGLAS